MQPPTSSKCPGIWRGVPGSVCPVEPFPKVPGRLAGGSVSGGGPSAPAATRRRRRPEGRGQTQSAPESGGGFPAAFAQLGRFPKCPGGWRGVPCLGRARRWRQPSVGTISRPVGVPSAPHPIRTPPPIQRRRDRIQKGEGHEPLPHHVISRPIQLKAAQSSKDYCGLT